MYISLAVRFPKGIKEEAVMMKEMVRFAEVQSKHKGFKQLVVAEVEDKGIIIPFTIWGTEEDFAAAWIDMAKYLATFDFKSNQEGPTRAGRVTIPPSSIISTLKVTPVVLPPR